MSPARRSTLFAFALALPLFCLTAEQRAHAKEADTTGAIAAIFEGEPKHHLQSLYARTNNAPFWSGDAARGRAAAELFRMISGADEIGIDPDEYPLKKISHLAHITAAQNGWTAGELAQLDLLMTDMFLQFGADQMYGRVTANSLDRRKIRGSEIEFVANILVGAAAKKDPSAAVRVIYPFAPDYPVLVNALASYREIAAGGGWPKIPARITKVHLGQNDESVIVLRERLLTAETSSVATLFDEEVEEAVKLFQLRHGLNADGHVGEGTLRELNISAAYRAKQVELNLERRRWVGRGFSDKYILVNIPTFTLRAVKNKETQLITRVCVGKKGNETPFVNTKVTAIELNPDWNVPKNIQNKEVIPEATKDPSWLTDRGIRALYGKGKDAVEVDPTTVDWASASGDDYRFVQPPGPGNALGQLKLVTPNPYDIYLHDTPQRALFKRPVRAFSHGCVRVEDPLQLAAWVLDDPEWDEGSIAREMNNVKSRTVKVAEPPEVYLAYWTAWADADGALRFAPDIYGWDAKLARALDRLPKYESDDASRVLSAATGGRISDARSRGR